MESFLWRETQNIETSGLMADVHNRSLEGGIGRSMVEGGIGREMVDGDGQATKEASMCSTTLVPGESTTLDKERGSQPNPQNHACPGCNKSFADVFKHLRSHPACKAAYSSGSQAQAQALSSDGLAARTSLFQAAMKENITEELGHMRYEALTSGSAVNKFKEGVSRWLLLTEERLLEELQPCISSSSGIDVAELIRSSLGWMKGIETEATEAANHRKLLGRALVTPVQRRLGTHKSVIKNAEGVEQSSREHTDYCYDIPLSEQLQALIEHDAAAWQQIVQSSESWSRTSQDDAGVIGDICDGLLFREHPKLGSSSGSIMCEVLGGKRLKLAFMMYYDEVETCNTLGFARGVHKIGCCYVKLLNLCPEMRDRLEYIFPVCLVLNEDMKRYGAELVIGGASVNPSTGERTRLDQFPSSLGAQMRRLDAPGVRFSVPTAEAFGGYEDCYGHGWMILCCADFPAAGLLLPTAQSVSAVKPCRGCNWDRTAKDACKPASLLMKKGAWSMRSFAQVWPSPLRRAASVCLPACLPACLS